MAKKIVPHSAHKCKVKDNPKTKSVAARFLRSEEPRYITAGEVLSMSNEDAIEFLRSVGFSQIIPGTHFAPEHDYAELFDVDWMTLHNYVYRYELGNKNQLESFSMNMRTFFKVAGLDTKGEVNADAAKSKIFDFRFNNTGIHYITRDAWSVRLLSARVAVAMIPLMANWGGKYRKEKVDALNEKLSVFLDVKRAQAAIAEAEKVDSSQVSMVSSEILYELIKKAVSEVMSGAKIAIAAPTVNT